MNVTAVKDHIVKWLNEYAGKAGSQGFVVGISGGIDSAVTSTLCALTGKPLIALSMPIRQGAAELKRCNEHLEWLSSNYSNVEKATVDLTSSFEAIENCLPVSAKTDLSLANSRARLRMLTLYAFAGARNLLVAGTGNKVEDFGVGFFTKYGDGGVDISPIADLMKTEVYALASYLKVPASIQKAAPTDGLFEGSPTDEQQLGASYPELEWAMKFAESGQASDKLTQRQREVLEIYRRRHKANLHKMVPIPVCLIPEELR